jgi:hypothetical protein
LALERDSRAEEELKLLLRSEFNYKMARERIKFKYEVLKPQIERLIANKGVLGLPGDSLFEIKVVDADPDHPAPQDGTDAT